MRCGEQLGFTGVSRAETMVSVSKGVLLLKVTQEMTTDYVFKDFSPGPVYKARVYFGV